MFDLITGAAPHAPRPQAGPVLLSIVTHALFIGGIVIGSIWFIAAPPPQLQMMTAFVAPPPPPSPPPPPAPAGPPERRKPTAHVLKSGEVPLIPPPELEQLPFDVGEGEVAGVVGGIPGGLSGDLPGGLIPQPPAAPPVPPPPAVRQPIRVGGEIKAPALVHKVDPEYPPVAIARQLQGTVILEAIVDEEGRVESVRVLRSPGIFDEAAIQAVKQWRYSPVLLNGHPATFILTVVVSFNLQ